MLQKAALSLCALLLSAIVASPATALVISGNGRAFGEWVSLNGNVVVSSGPLPGVVAAGPPPESESLVVPSVNPFPGTVTSGPLTVNAATDVDGGPGVRSATADATVESFFLGGALAPWITLTSTTIGSSAQVTGDFGALAPSGDVVLEDLAISVFEVPLVVPMNPLPNTVLYNDGGVRITLNEQGESLCALGSVVVCSIEVKAIHIEFTNAFAGTRVLNGQIIVAQSNATLAAKVPEPSLAVLALGTGVLLAAVRRGHVADGRISASRRAAPETKAPPRSGSR